MNPEVEPERETEEPQGSMFVMTPESVEPFPMDEVEEWKAKKIGELAELLEIDADEIRAFDTQTFYIGDGPYADEYLVLTDEEAREAVEIYIQESVWAFNPWFIIAHSDLPYGAEEMVKGFCEEKCEGANETVLALITDFDEFVNDAIAADGRGHFLNHYDGVEHETENFFVYRVN